MTLKFQTPRNKNDMAAEISRKKFHLKKLKEYSEFLQKLIDEKLNPDGNRLKTLKQRNEELEYRVLVESMESATRSHMLERDK